jgi:hypothetical protein
MKNKHCIYTSFNKYYLPQAILLLNSIKEVYGNKIDVIALVVDEIASEEAIYFDKFDRVLLANTLEILNFESWIRTLSVVEACTAVKPFALMKLLDEYSTVTYMDPDTYLFGPLKEIYESDEDWNIALTPHQLKPAAESYVGIHAELDSYKFGIFNLGFISVKNSPQGYAMAQWWTERCYEYCLSKPEIGLFTDQKFFDLAPVIFENLKIIRSSGYNVATWNISQRILSLYGGRILANDDPLTFCHFTKVQNEGINALERMEIDENLFREIFHSYKNKLKKIQLKFDFVCKDWAYSSGA